jgi:hypothetical protein
MKQAQNLLELFKMKIQDPEWSKQSPIAMKAYLTNAEPQYLHIVFFIGSSQISDYEFNQGLNSMLNNCTEKQLYEKSKKVDSKNYYQINRFWNTMYQTDINAF